MPGAVRHRRAQAMPSLTAKSCPAARSARSGAGPARASERPDVSRKLARRVLKPHRNAGRRVRQGPLQTVAITLSGPHTQSRSQRSAWTGDLIRLPEPARARPCLDAGPPPRQRGMVGNSVIILAQIGDLAGFAELADGSFRRSQRPNGHRPGTLPVPSRGQRRTFASAVNTDAGLRWAREPVVVRPVRRWLTVGSPVASPPAARGAKPLLGLRRKPGRLALAVFRIPLPLYRRGWGGLLGHTFLLLVHAGRKTGKPHSTTAMVLSYDPQTREAVIFSAWGQDTDWIRNIRVRPALQVQIGRESFTPQQRFLSEDESVAVVAGFRRRHPWRLRLATSIMGWEDLRSDAAAREFVRTRPFVCLRPADPSPARQGQADGE